MPRRNTSVFGVIFYTFMALLITLFGIAPATAGSEDGAVADHANGRAEEGAADDLAMEDVPALALDDVLAEAEARLNTIKTVRLLVTLEQYSPADGSVTFGQGRLQAYMPDVFRFDWLQPDMMAGSILLVDKSNNEAQQYNPIREEIIIQRWDHLAAQQNLGPEIDRWLSVPSPDEFYLELGETETMGDRIGYVVLARPKEMPEILYEFVVDGETWLISHFRQYDQEGRLALRGALTDIAVNGELNLQQMTSMPPYARVRRR